MSVLHRASFEKLSIASRTLWSDVSIANKIALDANMILNQISKRKHLFFNGKSFKFMAGGLLYLLGFRYDAMKKQREIADKLGTTDVTIRDSYRQLLQQFPDLFLDIMGKFAEDDDLRFFVFLDLKQESLQSEKKR